MFEWSMWAVNMDNYKIIYGSKNEEIIVDPEDYDRLVKLNWNCYTGYARTFRRRKEEGGKFRGTLMHKMILKAEKGLVTDHINGNKLDNRKSNLRICTPRQNSCNRKIGCQSKSRFLGVTYHKRDNRFQASIRTGKERLYLGYFKTDIEAAMAYNEAAQKYHGEFARLNKIYD